MINLSLFNQCIVKVALPRNVFELIIPKTIIHPCCFKTTLKVEIRRTEQEFTYSILTFYLYGSARVGEW